MGLQPGCTGLQPRPRRACTSACSLICPSAKTLALALVCAAASLTSSAVGREASSSRRASSAARAPASFFASISARASARARAPGGSASPPLGGLPPLLARATHTGRAGCSASEAEVLSPPPSEEAPRWPLPRRGVAAGLARGCTEGGHEGESREAEPGAAGSRPPPCVAEACGMAEPCSSSKLGRRSDGEVGGVLAAAAAVAAAAAATIAIAASASATASALASAAAVAAASASASASSRSDSDERREKLRSLSPRDPAPGLDVSWARGATWDPGAGEGRVGASAGVSESLHSWASTASPPPAVVPPSLPPNSSMVSCLCPATCLGLGPRVESKG